MKILFLTLIALSLVPLFIGFAMLWRTPRSESQIMLSVPASILLCALSFNLTFFVQEIGLVVPKALVPDLNPILYHNDHSWSGDAEIAELLQGTGAIATLTSGLVSIALLRVFRNASATWRLFFFWMSFQGLYQALTQLAIGALVAGNDMGRALAFLQISQAGKMIILAVAVLGLAVSGLTLARIYPFSFRGEPARYNCNSALHLLLVSIIAVALVIPFRMPRELIEVLFVPMVVNIIGVSWMILGTGFSQAPVAAIDDQPPTVIGPATALVLTLVFFQLFLRPGVEF
ncbi:hypothetical protein FKG94_12175 [Exilibacterium tricleocarpae]|uniref:Uncharacterized protein n=1 Tax=Exilibacterium tricleocarpae TaxID=2591008 RepID=A0A545TNM6_9GAMM|nr:hypothetical protein [Exilibacterium tricleocarpae]TQV78771.1 hypothetical protein FKG94_12175 [Exilibacterium tricleocarpae]